MIEINLNKYAVVFAPATVQEEVVQNIRMILSTIYFSVPYHREFAITADYLDDPIHVSQMRMRADIAEKILKYEPRAKLEEIVFQGDAINGYTKPIVRISLND